LAVCLFLVSCREKENCTSCEGLSPPLGIAFSVPQGDVSFFRFGPMELVHSGRLTGWSVVAAEVSVNGQWLAVADGAADRVALLKLPELYELSGAVIGGAPLDVDVDVSGHLLYAITNNGYFWCYHTSSGQFDMLEVELAPRRLALRPPDGGEAWIVCGGNNTIHVVDLRQFIAIDTFFMPLPPTDIQFSGDGGRFYVAMEGDTGSVAVFDALSRALIREQRFGRGAFELAVSDDERFVAASDSATGRLYVWDTGSGATWDVPVGRHPLRTRFARGSHVCYAMSVEDTRLLRINIGDAGPEPADTFYVTPTLRDFVLWEAIP
jgi:DNA-binding beta-propeller fold protein YncE